MSDFSGTKKRIENVTGEKIEKNTDEFRTVRDTGSVEELIDNTELTSGSCNRVFIEFRDAETGDMRAKCEYLKFHTEDIGLIEWMEVHESITGEQIGRMLRKEMIDDMEDRKIYTNIINTSLISVAIDQGFRKIREGELKGWFVQE